MKVAPIDNLNVSPALTRARAAPPRDFDAVLAEQTQARDAAQQLVSSAFVLPLLQQLRDDPLRTELFHGGHAEDLFGQKLDTILADRIVKRANFSLVDAVYDRITKRSQAESALNVDG